MDDIKRETKHARKMRRYEMRIGRERLDAKRLLAYPSNFCLSSSRGLDYLKRAFLTELDYREKRNHGRFDYQRMFFYIASDGRLAYVSRKNKAKLYREKLIDPETRKAHSVINKYGASIISHRRVIEDLYFRNTNICERSIDALKTAFDLSLPCTMTIDTDFYTAYEPIYHDNYSTDGDAATAESCMSERGNDAQAFYGGIEGCKIARFENDDGEQVGRCIVYEYEGKRHFVRVYGLPKYHHTMLNLIKEEMKDCDVFGRGVALQLSLKTNWDETTPAMYLDGDEYGITFDKHEQKWYVVSYDYEHNCKTTSGDYIEKVYGNRVRCKHCDEYVDYEDAIVRGDDCYYCCTSCAEADGWRICEYCGEHIDTEYDDYVQYDGAYYCDDECAHNDGLTRCSCCNLLYEKEDVYSTSDGEVQMCESCASDNGYLINDYGHLYKEDEQN